MARSIPVVGIFGGDQEETLDPADQLGEAIATARATLLTGGGRELTEPSVKQRAMEGARRAEWGQRGARISVLGKEEKKVWVKAVGDQILLSLAYKHRRNYVNAMLCDVAVAFPGGDGTTSEVAFPLAAERPVILLGDEWAAAFPVVRSQATYDAFIKSATTRVPERGKDPVDVLIRGAYRKLTLESGTVVEHLPLDHPAVELAARAKQLAHEDGLQGHFPDLSDRAEICTTYNKWLDDLERAARPRKRSSRGRS
jgi:predicted Rossmann-fold nucleotide-binding protein